MSDGKTHYRIWKNNIVLAAVYSVVVSTILYITFSITPLSALVISFGYLLGKYVSPDWDLVGINSDESRLMNDFGIFGVLVVMLALPYAYIMRFVGIGKKGHRNFFSHFPVVGTIIRVAWIFSAPAILILYFNYISLHNMIIVLLLITVGLSLADLLHYLADTLNKRSLLIRWMSR